MLRKKKIPHWHSDNIVITWAVGHLLELKSPDEYNSELKDWRKSLDLLPYVPESFERRTFECQSELMNSIQEIVPG